MLLPIVRAPFVDEDAAAEAPAWLPEIVPLVKATEPLRVIDAAAGLGRRVVGDRDVAEREVAADSRCRRRTSPMLPVMAVRVVHRQVADAVDAAALAPAAALSGDRRAGDRQRSHHAPMAPPLSAELSAKLPPVTVRVPVASMAPPSRPTAWLLVNVLFVTVSGPLTLSIAPPSCAVLPLNVLLVTVPLP